MSKAELETYLVGILFMSIFSFVFSVISAVTVCVVLL